MAQQTNARDISPVLSAATDWISTCLVSDGSILSKKSLWTTNLIDEVHHAFVDHPDFGGDDFITKLKGQMKPASPDAKRLMAEMVWALLLFPSRMKTRTKRQQVRDLWALSGETIPEDHPALSDAVLSGIGSGGPGFNNYRPNELEYLVDLARNLKQKSTDHRKDAFNSYDGFIKWIDGAPRKGSRQYRHMLRYFAFPDRVERISSNNDRRKILDGFGTETLKATKDWSDRQLDDALLKLRQNLEAASPHAVLDFYEPPLRERWAADRKVITAAGTIPIIVPDDEDEEPDESGQTQVDAPVARQSIKIQAELAEIGAVMGFKIWIPPSDRVRVSELVSDASRHVFLETLPLNYDVNTLTTISQIDVLWLKKQSIVRAFEVEHTTAVYSGLLRMADLLALQPNMKINLHIVAPDERKDKVFREMLRPVFTYLDAGPLYQTCSFLSYESVHIIRGLNSLAHTNDSIIVDYEERADEGDT